MSNYQRLKRTASGVQVGDPTVGELVLNTASGYLYTTRDDGALVLINNGIPGPTGPSGAVGPSGAAGTDATQRYLLDAFDTTTQINSAISGNAFTYDTTVNARGIAIVSGSMIQVANSGVYNIQFIAQMEKTSANTEDVDIWFRKNNVDVPWSATTIAVAGSSEKRVAAWNYFLSMDTNEFAEIIWHTADINVKAVAVSGITDPVHPSIPSIILTVNNVD